MKISEPENCQNPSKIQTVDFHSVPRTHAKNVSYLAEELLLFSRRHFEFVVSVSMGWQVGFSKELHRVWESCRTLLENDEIELIVVILRNDNY